MDLSHFNLPSNIKLADPSFSSPSETDLLIGASCFWDLLTEGNIKLLSGPHIQNTHLGWIVSGSIFLLQNPTNKVHCNFLTTSSLPSSCIESQMKRFWEVEEVPLSG